MSHRGYRRRYPLGSWRARALGGVLAAMVTVAGTACVGRLGRNDDDVRPDSNRPSVDHSIRSAAQTTLP